MQAPGTGSLASQLDAILHTVSLGVAQLQGPCSPMLQPEAPTLQLRVRATAWEVPVLLCKPRSPLRQHQPGSPPAQLTQQGVPRGASGAAAEQAPYSCWSKCCRGRRGRRAAVMGGNPLLQLQTPRLGAELPLGSPRTGKKRGPGRFAVVPRFLVLGWRKQEPPNKVSFYLPRETHVYYHLPCCRAAPSPHPNLPNRPGTPCNTITLQIKPESNFTATTEPGMGASRPHPPSHILSNVGGKGVPSRAVSHSNLGPWRGGPELEQSQPHQSGSATPWLWPRSA